MKRLLIIASIIIVASSASAMSKRPDRHNINLFGSDDHQRSHNHQTVTPPPDRPVNPVPEPATLFLLGAGLVGLAAYERRK